MMTANGAASDELVTGRVTSVNPKGVKLDGHADWFNFSRYAVGIAPPERGQTVTVTLDRQGFVRCVAAADGSQEPAGSPQATPSQRETTITRLAVLKAAAEFGASRPDLKSADILKISETWEAWILRE